MKLLLDTHTFLWFINGSDELSKHARKLIEARDNTRFLSVGSLWEMAIKVGLGKLKVPLPFTQLVHEHVRGNAIELLSLQAEHLDEQRTLPFHHDDPFDRLIIAQAIVEGMVIVSRDGTFETYPITTVWK